METLEIDPDFNIQTSYHNDFFLLRTRVLVNGENTEIRSVKEAKYEGPVLNFRHSGNTVSTKLLLISRTISPILVQYGVYHVDTFYYEQSPLFHIGLFHLLRIHPHRRVLIMSWGLVKTTLIIVLMVIWGVLMKSWWLVKTTLIIVLMVIWGVLMKSWWLVKTTLIIVLMVIWGVLMKSWWLVKTTLIIVLMVIWGVLIVISLPGGSSFCARPHPREGYNYYITCYLGNIFVEERYEQHSYMLPR